jgi:hypothetical protein
MVCARSALPRASIAVSTFAVAACADGRAFPSNPGLLTGAGPENLPAPCSPVRAQGPGAPSIAKNKLGVLASLRTGTLVIRLESRHRHAQPTFAKA